MYHTRIDCRTCDHVNLIWLDPAAVIAAKHRDGGRVDHGVRVVPASRVLGVKVIELLRRARDEGEVDCRGARDGLFLRLCACEEPTTGLLRGRKVEHFDFAIG